MYVDLLSAQRVSAAEVRRNSCQNSKVKVAAGTTQVRLVAGSRAARGEACSHRMRADCSPSHGSTCSQSPETFPPLIVASCTPQAGNDGYFLMIDAPETPSHLYSSWLGESGAGSGGVRYCCCRNSKERNQDVLMASS